jgi:glycosyltransferase involved in cell wall biosynthesis
MKIGVALHEITFGATGGLTVVIREVLEALFAGWPEHEVVLFHTPVNEHMFPVVPAHVHKFVLDKTDYHTLVAECAARLGTDVLFYPYPSEIDSAFPLSRQIVMIPDCQHEYFPEFFPPEVLASRRLSFTRVRRGAGAIATLSEHARHTLLNHPDAGGGEVVVVSPALRTDTDASAVARVTEAERALVPETPYFFLPANLWPHKNHRRVFRAFEQFLRTSGQRAEIVCTGHPDGWEELVREFPGLPVRHLGYVSTGLLRLLLERARALAFFPLFEGFGMPLLEAFAAGTPVICSNTTSLPEVGRNAVLSCDPTDSAAMSALMTRVFADQALRTELIQRGRERLAQYSWHTSTANFVAACERIAARPAQPGEDPFAAVGRLVQLVRGIQNERDLRLAKILQLDAACAARLKVMESLTADLKQTHENLQRAYADLGQAGEHLRQTHEQLQSVHAELGRSQAELRHSRSNNEALRMRVARLEQILNRIPLVWLVRLIKRVCRAVSARYQRLVRGV